MNAILTFLCLCPPLPQIYALRKNFVNIPDTEAAKLMKWFDRLLMGPGEHDEVVGAEARGAEGAAAPPLPAASDADEEKPKKGKDHATVKADFSCKAMKQVTALLGFDSWAVVTSRLSAPPAASPPAGAVR